MNTMQPTTTTAWSPATSGRLERGQERTASVDCCPACGQHSTLIALGVRYDHPYRWRPWITKLTPLALCDRCDALVAMRESPSGVGLEQHSGCRPVWVGAERRPAQPSLPRR